MKVLPCLGIPPKSTITILKIIYKRKRDLEKVVGASMDTLFFFSKCEENWRLFVVRGAGTCFGLAVSGFAMGGQGTPMQRRVVYFEV